MDKKECFKSIFCGNDYVRPCNIKIKVNVLYLEYTNS